MEGSALALRIAETIQDFVEANPTTVAEMLDALEVVYACVERQADGTPCVKMH